MGYRHGYNNDFSSLPGLHMPPSYGSASPQEHSPPGLSGKDNVRTFTLAEYLSAADYCYKESPSDLYCNHKDTGYSEDWDAGVSGVSAVKHGREGHLSTATDMMGYLDSYTVGAVTGYTWAPEVCGTRVSVPDYLGGNPKCMRQRRKAEKQAQHVTVWVECISSSGISADKLRNRGLAILAFVESLRRLRISVELNLMCALPTDDGDGDKSGNYAGAYHHVIRMDTNPLDLSTTGFCLSHPAFYRNVMYTVGSLDGFNGQSPPGQRSAQFDRDGMYLPDNDYEKYVRERVGMGQDDVYIPLPKYQDKMLENPKAWLNAKLAKYLGGVE